MEQGFHVHRQDARAARGKLVHKTHQPLLEGGQIQHTQEAGKGVVAGYAVSQRQEGWPEFPLDVS